MEFSSKLRIKTTMEAKRDAKNVSKLNSSKLAGSKFLELTTYCISTFHLRVIFTHLGSMKFS